VSNFFFSLIFAAYQKIKKLVISFGYCPKYIISVKNQKKRVKRKAKKKSFKKLFIGFCRRKLNKGNFDQPNFALAQI
jgi:hypothetical protein